MNAKMVLGPKDLFRVQNRLTLNTEEYKTCFSIGFSTLLGISVFLVSPSPTIHNDFLNLFYFLQIS